MLRWLEWKRTDRPGIHVAHALALAVLVGALAAYMITYDRLAARSGLFPFFDPELWYLMNSLLPFKGRGYVYFDHPGTPLEIIGTALLALTWPLAAARSASIPEINLRQPYLFLIATHALLTLASIWVVVLLARRGVAVERASDILLSLAVASSFYSLHPYGFESLVYWSHNSFNFPAGGLLALALYLRLGDGRFPGRGWLAAMGIAAGALAAVTFYMAAWTIGIAVAVGTAALLHGRGRRRAQWAVATVCVASAVGFVVVTLPVARWYGYFARFILAMLTHEGPYGAGRAGFSLEQLGVNVAAVWEANMWLLTALTLIVVAIASAAVRDRRSLRENAGRWAVALGLATQAGLLLLVICRHPSLYYTQAVAALVPVLMAIAFSCWRSSGRIARTACVTFSVLVLAGAAYRYPLSLDGNRNRLARMGDSLDRVDELLRRRQRSPGVSGPEVRMWSYGSDSPCFALWCANFGSALAFSREIARECPRDGMAWVGGVAFAREWLALTTGTTSAVLIATEAGLRRDPSLELWGPVERTDIPSVYTPYVVIPFSLDRLRPHGLKGQSKEAGS